MPNPISITIITFNEEKNIEKCLKQALKLSNDIIILDSFSSDQTIKICEGFHNVQTFQHRWGNYSTNKNLANSYAKNDWILSLDADEVLSEDLIHSIQKETQKGLTGVYKLNRITNYCGKWIRHGGWYPDWKVRLFNRTVVQWEGNIHEELAYGNLPVHTLKGDLLHYSYYSIEQHVNQYNKFTNLTAEKDIQRGKRSSLFKIFFSPLVKFIKDYIIKRGFQDGYYGFVIALISSQATFIKYVKMKELQKEHGTK